MTDPQDLVIVGSGIAGLSAAVYAARADLAPLVLEGDQPGGQLTLTTDVENYLGFPDGVGGSELIERGREQAKRFGAEFERGTLEAIDTESYPFELLLSTGDSLRSRAVIVATGAYARTLGVPGEDELMGFGLSTCATCDAAFHRGDDVLVVGGGDSAMEEALFLSKFAESVTIVHRRDELRASDIMARRVHEQDGIDIRWNTEVVELHGSREDGIIGATVVTHPDGYPKEKLEQGLDVKQQRLSVGGAFYAIGHVPNTEFLEDTPVKLDEEGYVRTAEGDERATMTGVPGVFAAGDVMDPTYRQAITAAGFGSMASLDAEGWLEAGEPAESETPAEMSG